MGTIDSATWFAFASTLTVVGALATWMLWRRRGAAAGLRALAFTLLPFAAYLTHTLSLVGTIISEIGSWAVHLVFSPVVWLGVGLAGMSVVLFVISGMLRDRAGRRADPGVGAATRAPGLPATASRKKAGTPAVADDDDMADIAAILKKHGIS